MAPLSKLSHSTYTSTSSRSGMTPTTSDDSDAASHNSPAGSDYTTTDAADSSATSNQLMAYLNQPATSDSSLYGRLADPTADEQTRIAFHTDRAQQTIDRFDKRFQS
ncbi:hypothetical protein N658DRAFT_485342 [Parathielavia hyrcaniae]|uniref:Uncharacterized protein n=1 Tax=Parathielavia hyrcaniae TaxID=113614 RepID=A0AAN6T3B9_9PEZI|nr:hypothetical protein N658DRAFT_485342 [Parathielavia hyrcaniae]